MWDKGNAVWRRRFLDSFNSRMANATAPRLEEEYDGGASLLLMRIIVLSQAMAWRKDALSLP
jgi:hypothetical protein